MPDWLLFTLADIARRLGLGHVQRTPIPAHEHRAELDYAPAKEPLIIGGWE